MNNQRIIWSLVLRRTAHIMLHILAAAVVLAVIFLFLGQQERPATQALSGQSKEQSHASLPTELPSGPEPSPVPTIVAKIAPSVDMTEAWDTSTSMITIPTMYGADYKLAFCNTITPDGQSLVCEAMSVDFGEDGGSRPGKVVMVDIAGKSISEIHTLPKNNTQAFDISADSRWVVWIEASDMGNNDAVIYAYDLSTRQLREITRVSGNDLIKGAVASAGSPSVDNGVVVWGETAASDADGSIGKRVLKKMDLATGQTETLAENAFPSKISWPYISWAQVKESTRQYTTFSITVLNLQTGVKKVMRDPYTPQYDIHGDTVVWVTGNGEVVLTDVDETYKQLLMRDGYKANVDGVTINDRLVSWNGGKAQV